ncbi:metalloregulator ArsR/SmtB family transcription factor [Asticcacaulis sp. BYS171W]|uniref:Metalloregulator ArsR/SmtB family transcription factor n=1 Tax=Asticcacaulis aquaticus TaxID=2984212 RepID=A0ABT5HYG4_9CAUL|nr:metalloregulator ArsR/SmtB family transcription factor [Asticcacaulis aquaticus]MDC7684486.1 metalloregulator ArsR/SmtB family transcription factor [Asticcacaulis aquaticus]
MDKNKALEALAALSQETRLDVFRLLVRVGAEGLPAGEIGERLGVKQNTMSANLSVLAHAGLVRTEREGRSIRYFADFDGMRGFMGYLLENCCGGDPAQCQPVLAKLSCC